MSRHCPSCGSTVQEGDRICPTCGEALDGAPSGTPAEEIVTVATEPRSIPPAAEAPAAPAAAGTIACAECGAENEPGATECTVCGSALAGQLPSPVAETSAPARRAVPSSSVRDYLLTTVAAVALGAIVLLVSTPEEKTGPPMPAGDHGAAGAQMPQGHPPASTPQVTAEQQQQIAEAEKTVAASPNDLNAKLKLANLYYDIDRHAEAIPLYREYVKTHPEDLSARTDMAFSLASTAGLDSGIVELHQVLQSDPRFQNAVYNLAMMHIAKRNRDSTLYWLQRTVEIDPNSRPGKFAAEILHGVQSGAIGNDSTAPAAR